MKCGNPEEYDYEKKDWIRCDGKVKVKSILCMNSGELYVDFRTTCQKCGNTESHRDLLDQMLTDYVEKMDD